MSTLRRPSNVSPARLKEALEVCEQVAAKDRSNLYVTSQFFEDRARYDAFIAMYAVMRLVDDFVDDIPDKGSLDSENQQRLIAVLDQWDARIRCAYAGTPGDDPVDVALCAAVTTFPVPLRVWLNFINAMRFDVHHPRFRDFAEFLSYGEGATVAPTVIYVYLLTSQPQQGGQVYLVEDFDFETCGRELGLFAYLAHILRDVAQDMRVGKEGLVYLSQEDLRRHELTEDILRSIIQQGQPDARWAALVQDLCSRARAMETRGVALVDAQMSRMTTDCAFILSLIITVYSELLRRIEAQPDDVLRGDPMMSSSEKGVLAAAAARRTGYPWEKVMVKMGLG
jgi:phytoene synthase